MWDDCASVATGLYAFLEAFCFLALFYSGSVSNRGSLHSFKL